MKGFLTLSLIVYRPRFVDFASGFGRFHFSDVDAKQIISRSLLGSITFNACIVINGADLENYPVDFFFIFIRMLD